MFIEDMSKEKPVHNVPFYLFPKLTTYEQDTLNII